MKKILLVISTILCSSFAAYSQSGPLPVGQQDIDDALQGTSDYQFSYSGNWAHGSGTTDLYYNRTCSFSNTTSAYATISFTGNDFRLTVSTAPHHGIMGVTVDSQPEKLFDLYESEQHIKEFYGYQFEALSEGRHTVKIRVTGTKNPAATNTYVVVDFISFVSSSSNTAIGVNAHFNKGGYDNTAVGANALVGVALQYGNKNTAVGASALVSNRGGGNTAVGYLALGNNGRGGGNVAMGNNAAQRIALGVQNTAIGSDAMSEYTSGWWNTAVGAGALRFGSGSNNVAVGTGSGMTDGSNFENTTAIGAGSTVTASNQVRIGNSSVTSIGGQVSWATLSDGRFKRDIKEDVSGLEFIRQLRPVSYAVDYNAFDKFLRVPDSLRSQRAKSRQKVVRQTGFVAQEVESLVKKTGYTFAGVEAPKNENDHYSIRYAEFVVPLVKAVQELTEKMEAQEKVVEDQQQMIQTLADHLKKYGVNTEDVLSKDDVRLFQNNPNPFTVDTEIKMSLPESAQNAKVIVYNMEGRQLKAFEVRGRGETSITITGDELGQGMYLYALIVDGKVADTKRMILTK
ncbi:tail fiber domain-containing protein [Chryseolinea sp. H1M3-3]|uniref:tail fiber domain-containing protein n=1 Tax=Chryseolinea sp. H1M3-3 TaxID=3034144 RepID=UPI0023ED2FC0|nr:tail fiber domain-containing protein [Chryseolinea sp. H1M3-3]